MVINKDIIIAEVKQYRNLLYKTMIQYIKMNTRKTYASVSERNSQENEDFKNELMDSITSRPRRDYLKEENKSQNIVSLTNYNYDEIFTDFTLAMVNGDRTDLYDESMGSIGTFLNNEMRRYATYYMRNQQRRFEERVINESSFCQESNTSFINLTSERNFSASDFEEDASDVLVRLVGVDEIKLYDSSKEAIDELGYANHVRNSMKKKLVNKWRNLSDALENKHLDYKYVLDCGMILEGKIKSVDMENKVIKLQRNKYMTTDVNISSIAMVK